MQYKDLSLFSQILYVYGRTLSYTTYKQYTRMSCPKPWSRAHVADLMFDKVDHTVHCDVFCIHDRNLYIALHVVFLIENFQVTVREQKSTHREI